MSDLQTVAVGAVLSCLLGGALDLLWTWLTRDSRSA